MPGKSGSRKPFGRIRVISGTNPAAGVEITETVPAGKMWKLRAAFITFVTGAAVASRVVQLMFDDGANVFGLAQANATQIASLTRYYAFGIGLDLDSTQVGVTGVYKMPLPDVWLGPGYRFRTNTTNLQAADDYGAPIYEVEEFDA